MTQVLIDRTTLEQLVAALKTGLWNTRALAGWAPSEIDRDYNDDNDKINAALTAGRAALANAEPVKPIAFGRMIDGDIADVVCPETHEFYEGDYTVPLYTQPLAANNSAKTLKELAVKGCGECFYQDCDFPNCCKPKMRSDILKDTL